MAGPRTSPDGEASGGAADPPSWVIERAAPADEPALAALMAASPLLRRYATTIDSARAALARAWAARDSILVIRGPGGAPIGLAWLMANRMLGSAYLRLLLVAEGRQAAGLGARLLAAAEADARTWANHMLLLVTTDNAGARRFYERAGYRHVGDLPGLVAPGLDEALYHKPLRPHDATLPV